MKKLKTFLDKFIFIEKELTDEKGDFVLFGLFLREGSPNKWDVVVSAPWLDESSIESLDFMIKRIQSKLELQEQLMMSAVLVLDPSQEFVKEMNEEVRVEHGNVKLMDYIFNGMGIERAHIITSKPDTDSTGHSEIEKNKT